MSRTIPFCGKSGGFVMDSVYLDNVKSENQICSDCVKRFACVFNAFVPKKTCELYESDTELVKTMIYWLSGYLESKQKDNLM